MPLLLIPMPCKGDVQDTRLVCYVRISKGMDQPSPQSYPTLPQKGIHLGSVCYLYDPRLDK